MSSRARTPRDPDPTDIDKDEWVLTPDVIRYLGITTPTLYRWMDAGLPSHQVIPRGKRYFVIREVDAWINSRRTSPEAGRVVA